MLIINPNKQKNIKYIKDFLFSGRVFFGPLHININPGIQYIRFLPNWFSLKTALVFQTWNQKRKQQFFYFLKYVSFAPLKSAAPNLITQNESLQLCIDGVQLC